MPTKLKGFSFVGGVPGQITQVSVTYQVSRVTISDIAPGNLSSHPSCSANESLR
jgi:hypothetical protein